jgi:hydrogenase maturation factor
VLPAVDVRLVAEEKYGDMVVIHFGAICIVVADKIVVEG